MNVIVNTLSGYVEAIEKNVDLEAVKRHEFIVRSDLNENLVELGAQMEKVMYEIKLELSCNYDRLNTNRNCTVNFEHSDKWGHHMRVSRNNARFL